MHLLAGVVAVETLAFVVVVVLGGLPREADGRDNGRWVGDDRKGELAALAMYRSLVVESKEVDHESADDCFDVPRERR